MFASEIWGAYIREGLLSEGYLPLGFGRLIIGRIFASEIWGGLLSEGYLCLRFGGLIFRRAYYQKDICLWDLGGLFSGGLTFGGLIIGILRYVTGGLLIFCKNCKK